MPIAKPTHLDPPTELVVGTQRTHIYEANSDGKLLLESLLWLCSKYRYVNLVALIEVDNSEAVSVLHCRAAFIERDFERNTDN